MTCVRCTQVTRQRGRNPQPRTARVCTWCCVWGLLVQDSITWQARVRHPPLRIVPHGSHYCAGCKQCNGPVTTLLLGTCVDAVIETFPQDVIELTDHGMQGHSSLHAHVPRACHTASSTVLVATAKCLRGCCPSASTDCSADCDSSPLNTGDCSMHAHAHIACQTAATPLRSRPSNSSASMIRRAAHAPCFVSHNTAQIQLTWSAQ